MKTSEINSFSTSAKFKAVQTQQPKQQGIQESNKPSAKTVVLSAIGLAATTTAVILGVKNKNLKKLCNEANKTAKNLGENQKTIQDLKSQLKKLQEKNNLNEKDKNLINELQQKLADAEKSAKAIKEETVLLEEQLTTAKKNAETFEKENAEKLAQKDSEIAKKEQSISELKAQIKELQAKATLNKEDKKALDELKQKLVQAEKEAKLSKEKTATLEEKLNIAKKDAEVFEEEIEQKNSIIAENEQNIKRLKAQLKELQAKTTTSEKDINLISELQQKLADAEKSAKSLKEETVLLEEQLTTAKKNAENTAKESAEKLAQKNQELESKNKNINELENRIKTEQNKNKAFEEQINNLMKEKDIAENNISKLKKQLKELQDKAAENKDDKKIIDELNKKLCQAEEKIKTLEENLTEANKNTNHYMHLNQAAGASQTMLNGIIRSHEKTIKTLSEEKEALTKEIDSIKKEYNKLNQKFKENEKLLEQEQKASAKKDSKIEELKNKNNPEKTNTNKFKSFFKNIFSTKKTNAEGNNLEIIEKSGKSLINKNTKNSARILKAVSEASTENLDSIVCTKQRKANYNALLEQDTNLLEIIPDRLIIKILTTDKKIDFKKQLKAFQEEFTETEIKNMFKQNDTLMENISYVHSWITKSFNKHYTKENMTDWLHFIGQN